MLVSQTRPIQAKTPHWQALPASATVQLEMPADSVYRCIVPPLQVTAETNTLRTQLKAWTLARSFRCSDDGWRSWTEAIHRVRKLADGSRQDDPDTGILLRERGEDGAVREAFVLLRADKERTQATTGPPRILANALAEEE